MQNIVVGLYSFCFMEPFTMVRGEATPVNTLFKVEQMINVLNHAYSSNSTESEAWWDANSQCVGRKIGDPDQPVSVPPVQCAVRL